FALDTAPLPPRPNPGSHDNPVSGVCEGLRLRAECLERVRPFPKELPDTFVTVIGAADWAVMAFPDDRRVIERKDGVRILRPPKSSHDLHVLLRHRPRSIPQAQESA